MDAFYGLFVEPDPSLMAARLKRGRSVLEVGCGPEFFTIPATRIVGTTGRVYALDINPAAGRHVWNKIEKTELENAEVFLAEAPSDSEPQSYPPLCRRASSEDKQALLVFT